MITRIAVGRPVTTFMCVLMVLLLGVISVINVPADLLPEMTFPVIAVATRYSGAGPQEIETLVTRPIEEALGSVSNIQSISSESSEGASLVMLEFGWGTNMDQAALDVREAVDLVKRFLPADANAPLVFKADPSMLPIMRLSVSGDTDRVELTHAAEFIKGRLERIDGVSSVSLSGAVREEVVVEVIPSRLVVHGVPLQSIVQALRSENLNLPGGHVEEGGMRVLVRSVGQFLDLDDLTRTRVTTAGGGVTLDELATVSLGQTTPGSITRLNGRPSLGLSVQKQSGANTVQVSRMVRQELARLNRELPSGMVVEVAVDQASFITTSIWNVAQNAVIGGILAVVILYLFLSSIPTILVIGMAIPISLVATFSFIYFAGLTLNLLSLGGLALGVGMLVDNAIVVLENIFRYREQGLNPREASLTGTWEVAMPVTASTLTTLVVFLPVVFIQGLASQLFRQLAYTVSFALLSSLVVALTFIPMAASFLLSATAVKSRERAGRLAVTYRTWLAWCLARRGGVVLCTILVMAGVALVWPAMKMEFLPAMDRGEINIEVRLPRGSTLARTDAVLKEVEALVLEQPETMLTFASSGERGWGLGAASGGDVGGVLVRLGPAAGPTRYLVERLRREVQLIPGAEIRVNLASGLVGEEQLFGAPLVISVKGDDLEVLAALASDIATLVRAVPGTREVETSLQQGSPETRVVVDRLRAAHYGISAGQVATTVRAVLDGEVATRYRVAGSEIDVRVTFPPETVVTTSDLDHIMLLSPLGMPVPLSAVSRLESSPGPARITRQDQVRTVTVSSQVSGRDLGSVMEDVRRLVDPMPLPPGYSLEYGGETREMAEAFSTLGQALVLSIVLVYMVLASQFESLAYPFIIMVTVPLALSGAIYGLVLTGHRLSVPSIIGTITLAGIVVNNGIVLMDYTLQRQRRGSPPVEAALEAATTRLRPILMTTITTVLGLLPMALGGGRGSELQAPLALAVISGLVLATLLTLVVVPVLYTLLADLAWAARMLAAEKGAETL
ncbi:MAG: efflux RND transporter permease subunit [Bacillota bacterium]